MATTNAVSSNAINALGAGSGMDVKALATSLVEAERAPRKDVIDKKISKAEGGISGYSAIKFVLDGLKTSLMDIKDQSDFESLTTRNSQASAINITTSTTASAGTHNITVNSLAKAQRNLSNGFSNTSDAICSSALTLSLSKNSGTPTTITVAADRTTPGGIVSAINGANLGIKAQLINTGESTKPYRILITGETGRDSSFTLASSDSTKVDFDVGPSTPLTNGLANVGYDAMKVSAYQEASNGDVVVNGVPIQPATNKLTEVIPGVTIDLFTPTAGGPASVDLVRDTSAVKTKMTALVKAYNDANIMLNTVSDAKSTVETYGASLAGNSIVNSIRTQMREALFPQVSTGSSELRGFRDLGLSIDKEGVMTLDNDKLDEVLSTKFDEAVTMLTGNSENLSAYSTAPSGAVGSAFKALTSMLASTGTIATQSSNLTKRIAEYKDELTKLEDRMTKLMERYNTQFGAMESIVGQSKSLRTSLTSTFEGMMAAYTKG
jgi:flagellar hook-associated protein 2